MSREQMINCAFCQGTGNNPHFRGTCPVCKGKGENEVKGKYMTCGSCRGLGTKRGTTLTCYDCGGIGVIPDTRETFKKAREEIVEARKDLDRERPARQRPEPQAMAGGAELTEKPKSRKHKKEDQWEEESFDSAQDKKGEEESGGKTHFCQCCGDKVNDSVAIKICFDCFGKVKEMRGYNGI